MAIALFSEVGRIILSLFLATGRLSKFLRIALTGIFCKPYDKQAILKQMIFIGYYSLPVIGMTSIFSGAVLALQGYDGFSRFSAQGSIATIVVLSITRELGPVLAGLMISGRVGAAMAAEIATMRVTEQIDALYTLSTEPIRYLVTPRLIACVLMLPCLVLIGDVIGVMGGYLVSVYKLEFNSSYYILNTFKNLKYIDVFSGVIKAAVFGMIIAIIGCYSGYSAEKGAQGVGKATTAAVVNSSILILLSNYFLTELFFSR
jgi:phospholipid/cholesterol/gamma-HCH transport system permease protein